MSEDFRVGNVTICRPSKLWKLKPSSPYCVVLYFWWGCRGNWILITLGSEMVNIVLACRVSFSYWMLSISGPGLPRHHTDAVPGRRQPDVTGHVPHQDVTGHARHPDVTGHVLAHVNEKGVVADTRPMLDTTPTGTWKTLHDFHRPQPRKLSASIVCFS